MHRVAAGPRLRSSHHTSPGPGRAAFPVTTRTPTLARFVVRRLLLAIPVIIGATFFVFLLVYALPGDPIRALAGDRPLPPGVEAALRAEYNLDDPVVLQYLKYIGGLLQGDFGTDFSGREVSETIG